MTQDMPPSDDKPPAAPQIRPRRIIRNVIWMTGSGFVTRLIAFAISVFLARVVGAAGFGALGSALAFVSYFKGIVNAGLDAYATRDTAERHERIPALYARVIGARLALAGVSSLLIWASLLILPEQLARHADLIVIYGLILFAEAIATEWAIRGIERMALIAAGTVVQHLIMAAGILLFLPGREDSLWIVPAAHVASLFIMQGWFYWVLRAHFAPLRPSFAWGKITGVVKDSLSVAFGKALRLFYYQGDVLLLALLATQASAGEFFASHRIILVGVMVGAIYQTNAYPTTSRLITHDPASAVRFQSDIMRYALSLLAPAVVLGAWYAKPLILLVFGNDFPNTPAIFTIMIFSVPLFIFSMGAQNLLLAAAMGRQVLIGNAVAVAVHVGLALILIAPFAGVGAAWACLAGEIVCALAMVLIVKRRFGVVPLQRRMLAPLAAAGAMAGGLALASTLSIYAQLGLAGLVYGVLALVLRTLSRAELHFFKDFAKDAILRLVRGKKP
ncbi:MAG: flippase [Pseudomonadota bacterium]